MKLKNFAMITEDKVTEIDLWVILRGAIGLNPL